MLKIRTLSQDEINKFVPSGRGPAYDPAEWAQYVGQLTVGEWQALELELTTDTDARDKELRTIKTRLNKAARDSGLNIRFKGVADDNVTVPFMVESYNAEEAAAQKALRKEKRIAMQQAKEAGTYTPPARGRRKNQSATVPELATA